jgi:hypothetical protein
MRGCGSPRGFWLKPGRSVDRVEGIIIETFVILCQYNSQSYRIGYYILKKEYVRGLPYTTNS